MTSLQTVDFYQLVQATMKVERLETSSKERFQKKKFSRGASSSSGKRAREPPVQSEYSSAMRGRRQRSNVARSTSRGASITQGEILECPHCHRRHLGVFRIVTRGCFRCGSLEHLIARCPREIGIIEVNKEVAEEDLRHHFRLAIMVGVVVAHLSIEDKEA